MLFKRPDGHVSGGSPVREVRETNPRLQFHKSTLRLGTGGLQPASSRHKDSQRTVLLRPAHDPPNERTRLGRLAATGGRGPGRFVTSWHSPALTAEKAGWADGASCR